MQWSDELIDGFKYRGDPAADRAVAALLASQGDTDAGTDAKLRALQQAFAFLRPLSLNQDIAAGIAERRTLHGEQDALAALVEACAALPEWADHQQIERAEQLFREGGVVSCILFFCACLPEVYVVPDISTVLRATGNLEKMTDQRIRATSAMIMAALMSGGLRKAPGAGRPKVLKARFIHAVMRRLFLRGSPEEYVAQGQLQEVPPLAPVARTENAFRQALAHGWNPANDGVPCNQEELAYTLLTFGFVYLRGLRRLGLGFARADEDAYLHLWNVVGYLLGIDTRMMAHTMDDAAILFARLQVRARARPLADDPRGALGGALLGSIEKSIPHAMLQPAAALVVEYLTSAATARDLGFHARASLASRCVFGIGMGTAKLMDRVIRKLSPEFSLVRFLFRVAGYKLVHAVLTDDASPIDLPESTRREINVMLEEWSSDRHAPRWMNRMEDYFTTRGDWSESIGV